MASYDDGMSSLITAKCKRCGYKLCNRLNHEHLAHPLNPNTCAHLFVSYDYIQTDSQFASWICPLMNHTLNPGQNFGSTPINLSCPKCKRKVGIAKWSGMNCSCILKSGEENSNTKRRNWIAPAVALALNSIDLRQESNQK